MPATKRIDVGRRRPVDRVPPRAHALLRGRRRRLAALPRYDRSIAEAAGDLTLQASWRNLKRQDLEDAQRLASWMSREPMPPATAGGSSTRARRRAVAEEVRHAGPL